MQTIPIPDFDAEDVYNTISGFRRHKTTDRLAAIRPHIVSAYNIYDSVLDLSTLEPISLAKSDIKILKYNYAVLRTGKGRDIGDKILGQSKRCCLCAHNTSSQLDHHLPKARYPEFSCLPINLIPVCGVCNLAKKDIYKRTGGGAAFLHSYRHTIPVDERFLLAIISIEKTVDIRFDVAVTQGLCGETFEILKSHFTQLNLAELYGGLAIEVLQEKRDSLYDYYEEGGAGALQKYLARDARSAESPFGVSHWKPVLLNALAASEEFCEGGFRTLGPKFDR